MRTALNHGSTQMDIRLWSSRRDGESDVGRRSEVEVDVVGACDCPGSIRRGSQKCLVVEKAGPSPQRFSLDVFASKPSSTFNTGGCPPRSLQSVLLAEPPCE